MSREDTNLDENYDRSSISAGYVDRVRTEISAVVSAHPKAVLMYLTAQGDDDGNGQFGHDLYLTRDHHGVGFWDRGLGELGDYLTSVAHALGESDQLFDNGYGMLIA